MFKSFLTLSLLLINNLFANDNKITIVCFYTSWCPACKESIALLNDLHKKYSNKIDITSINLDDNISRKKFVNESEIHFKNIRGTRVEAEKLGLQDSIPFIIVKNQENIVIKKFHETPNKEYFFKLIQRLYNGYLENGMLPIEKRVDLWKSRRE